MHDDLNTTYNVIGTSSDVHVVDTTTTMLTDHQSPPPPSLLCRLNAQISFIISGLILILLNQFLADCGVNSPYAGFNGMAKGVGFLFCAAVWAILFRTPDISRSLTWRRARRVAAIAYPVAVADIMDTVFATGGIVWAKSGLFVIAFSSITVWVALLRRTCLRQRQAWNKWISVFAITGAIAASGAQSMDGNIDVMRMVGVAATLVAAFADACMYMFVEKLLTISTKGEVYVEDVDQAEEEVDSKVEGEEEETVTVLSRDNDDDSRSVSPFELLCLVGLVSTIFSCVWMFFFFVGGWWQKEVVPIPGCGFPTHNVTDGKGSKETVGFYLGLWFVLGVVGFGVHYVAFFYLVKHENCLTASVSKASQSAMIFFLSSLFFCVRSDDQCLTTLKIVCAVVVCLSVVLYSTPVKKSSFKC